MKYTREHLNVAIQAYADAYKSGNPNLIQMAAGPLQAMLQALPESWEAPAPAAQPAAAAETSPPPKKRAGK